MHVWTVCLMLSTIMAGTIYGSTPCKYSSSSSIDSCQDVPTDPESSPAAKSSSTPEGFVFNFGSSSQSSATASDTAQSDTVPSGQLGTFIGESSTIVYRATVIKK